jgi:50S ribosomal subunit-associated GTPase HflX
MTKLLIPYNEGDLLSALYQSSRIESRRDGQDGVTIEVQLPPALYRRLKEYEVT